MNTILWGAGMTREEFNEWARGKVRIEPAPPQTDLFQTDPSPMVKVSKGGESTIVPESWTESLPRSRQQSFFTEPTLF